MGLTNLFGLHTHGLVEGVLQDLCDVVPDVGRAGRDVVLGTGVEILFATNGWGPNALVLFPVFEKKKMFITLIPRYIMSNFSILT